VALARLASVFSRLVRRIWRAVSYLAGPVLAWVPFGRRFWIRGSVKKIFTRWALSWMDSVDSESLAGWQGVHVFEVRQAKA
jgi:hypothetical protein